MEIVIGLVLIAGLAVYLLRRNKDLEDACGEAPYKVESPKVDFDLPKMDEPRRCGCGRSSSGFCVGLHELSAAEWAENDANPHKAIKPVKAPKAKSQKTSKSKAPAMKVVKGDSPAKKAVKPKKPSK